MNTSTNINSTSPATEPAQFDFRNKFKKLLSDENRPAIEDVFRKFCKLSPEDALSWLWELTYRTDYTNAFRKLRLDPNLIPAESVIVLCNELQFQYQQSHPDFLHARIPANCVGNFEKLQWHTNFITAKVVYDAILSKVFECSTDIELARFLISSKEKNRLCGGLRLLDFSYAEIEYLKQFHNEIYDLFGATHEHFVRGISKRPFADLDDQLKKAGFMIIEANSDDTSSTGSQVAGAPASDAEVSPDVSSDSEQQFVPVTAFEVLTRKGAFSFLLESSTPMSYLHALQNLQGIGFDLNEVVKKEEKIKALLKSAGDLDA